MPLPDDVNEGGRGPGRFGHWYFVELFDGATFVGEYLDVNHDSPNKAEHVLYFRTSAGVRDVYYGDLESAIRLEDCPSCRHRAAMRRLGPHADTWQCGNCGYEQDKDPGRRRDQRSEQPKKEPQ